MSSSILCSRIKYNNLHLHKSLVCWLIKMKSDARIRFSLIGRQREALLSADIERSALMHGALVGVSRSFFASRLNGGRIKFRNFNPPPSPFCRVRVFLSLLEKRVRDTPPFEHYSRFLLRPVKYPGWKSGVDHVWVPRQPAPEHSKCDPLPQ